MTGRPPTPTAPLPAGPRLQGEDRPRYVPGAVGAHAEDEALVAACVAGDGEAWRTFDRRFRPVIARIARDTLARAGVRGADEAAEEVAAEVLAGLLADGRRTLASYAGRSSLAGWLAVIARRRAARHADTARRAPRSLEPPDDARGDERRAPGVEPAAAEDPTAALEADERRALVRAHVEALAPRDRLALHLFYEAGRSYREVAQTLGLPAARVGMVLLRARRRLARALGLLADDDAT